MHTNHNCHWIWMMWFETNPANPPETTLTEAMHYYTLKYGSPPTHVRIPLSWPPLNGNTPPGLIIERSPAVLKRHIFLATDPLSICKSEDPTF